MSPTTLAILQISLRVGINPLNVPRRHVFLTILLSLCSLRVQKPLQWAHLTLIIIGLKSSTHHFVRSKKSVCMDQWVVPQPPRPRARMALLLLFKHYYGLITLRCLRIGWKFSMMLLCYSFKFWSAVCYSVLQACLSYLLILDNNGEATLHYAYNKTLLYVSEVTLFLISFTFNIY